MLYCDKSKVKITICKLSKSFPLVENSVESVEKHPKTRVFHTKVINKRAVFNTLLKTLFKTVCNKTESQL